MKSIGNIPDSGATLFLSQLRTQTQDAHKALESLAISKRLLDDSVRLDDYIKYLERMQAPVFDFETRIKLLLPDQISSQTTPDRHLALTADLDFLNSGSDITKGDGFWGAFKSEAFCIGIAYVLEGSSLGGRVIYKHISNNLGLDSQTGAKFFSGNSAQTASHWKGFLDAMTHFALSTATQSEIIYGARFGFEKIYAQLNTAKE